MKAPFAAALVASTVFALSSGAWAQKKVVVEQFTGPSSDRFRQSVVNALGRASGIDVVSDKKVAAVEADLGLIQVSDSYAAVAKELKATAFVSGGISGGKKPRAKLTVRDRDGQVLGSESWGEANVNKLIAAINGSVGSKLSAILGGGGGKREDKAEDRKEEKKAPPKEEAVAVAEEKPAKKAKAEEAPPAAEEEEKPKRKRAKESEEATESEAKADATMEAEATATAEPEEEDRPRRAGKSTGKGLKLAFVMRFFSRNFAYNQSVEGGQQGYQAPASSFNNLPLVPAPGGAIEFFPTPLIGLTADFNYAIAGSKDSGGSVYKTTAYTWGVGAKLRLAMGSSIQIEPGLGYGGSVYKVSDFSGMQANNIQVAGVDYKHARAGGALRFALSGGKWLGLGGNYLHIMSAGEILDPKRYFYGKAMGGEVFADMTIPLAFASGLEAKIGLDVRRIAFAFDVQVQDPRSAGGAIDQYIGLNLALGYNVGL